MADQGDPLAHLRQHLPPPQTPTKIPVASSPPPSSPAVQPVLAALRSPLLPKTATSPARRRRAEPLSKGCNCKNSKCLKLYCECFASGKYCRPECHCVNCCNNEQYKAERSAAVQSILDRNPTAFYPKINDGSADSSKHSKGCNCKKSGCLKKYCECFQAGIVCSDICKCIECKNFEGSQVRAQALANAEIRETSAVDPKRSRAEPSMSTTPQKRPRALEAAGAVQQGPHKDGMERSEPSVLKGVIKPDVLRHLSRLLLGVIGEAADQARRANERESAGEQQQVHAVGESGPSSSSAEAGATQESERPPAGRSSGAANAPGGSSKPSALYEMQEARVLQEFAATLKKVVDFGRQKLHQRQQAPLRHQHQHQQPSSFPAGLSRMQIPPLPSTLMLPPQQIGTTVAAAGAVRHAALAGDAEAAAGGGEPGAAAGTRLEDAPQETPQQ